MVKQVHLKKLYECDDKDWLGVWPKREDVDEIYHEDVDVYLPDGTLAIVFRVGALKSTLPVSKGGTLTDENYKYWQWVSKALATDQRGFAAGKDITTNPEIRVTIGQWEFFSKAVRAKKPLVDAEEARKIIDSDTNPSRNTFYIGKTEADGLVNVEEVERWDSIVRKTSLPKAERDEAVILRNKEKLAWFENWLAKEWLPASEKDRPEIAKAARKRYITAQPRANRCYSNVVGTIDRAGRLPYGRMTVSTTKRLEEFESNEPFYREVNDIFQETMPAPFKVLNDRFEHVADPRYNLFGTAFTTITVNNNFQVAWHRDGNNAENAVAALCVMEQGDWSGGEFVFPELRLGFDIREGDIFIGDNQGLIHGMLPFDMKSDDAENIMFVFYQRDRILELDSLDCEACRKDFLAHAKVHLRHKCTEGKNAARWEGSWPGMWQSPEWVEFKLANLPKKIAKGCSNSNYHGTGHLSDKEILSGKTKED